MKIKTILSCFAVAAASALSTVTAQTLPAAHSRSTEGLMTMSFCEKSFATLALTSARSNTPFASVSALNSTKGSVDMILAGKIIDYAKGFLGTPYVWGAAGPTSFDCSGFTSYIYGNFGMKLMRTSGEQFTQGKCVSSVAEMQPGDLMFFSSRRSGRNGIGHVAMVVSVDRENGTCQFIHASTGRGVVYQNFPDDGYYSSHFMGARRIIGSDVVAQR